MSRYLTRQQREELVKNLLPCPLCGITVELDICLLVSCDPNDLDEEHASGSWSVICGSCGITLPGFDDVDLLVRRWNERTTQ